MTSNKGNQSTLIDLSHLIISGMETYPGFPTPQVSDYLTYEESEDLYAPGVTFHIGRVNMVANTGTAVDSPAHRYAGKPDIAEMPLESVADLDGVVIRLEGMKGAAVTKHAITPYNIFAELCLSKPDMRNCGERQSILKDTHILPAKLRNTSVTKALASLPSIA
ncbi:cyclase family protein [Neobacillus mesonae]|nr:cyclase family protein [Neobacillus mesonae]